MRRAEVWPWLRSFWETYDSIAWILLIILGAIVVRWILLLLLGRTVNRVVTGVKKTQQAASTREMVQSPLLAARVVQRTRTLGSVGGNLLTIVIGMTAIVLILAQLGINPATVLASAGFVAAGLAFGAQNIVKDVLNGIFMVFEDQLGVGDTVQIGTVTGTVEAVGIRITQVRSVDGTLWFIRNGEILQLGNQSHDWGRALLDVTVASGTDLDQATAEILEAAREVTRSREHARKILSTPEVWGLESVFADRATLRLTVKTRPDVQPEVCRALRAAIKTRFDAAGIRLAPEAPITVLAASAAAFPEPLSTADAETLDEVPEGYTQAMPSAGERTGTVPIALPPDLPAGQAQAPGAPAAVSSSPPASSPPVFRSPGPTAIPVQHPPAPRAESKDSDE
ncbi:mechanosensitive ion channel family protein [Leucobacter sp. M11]|uniref:mechanosensitive ion channel family protein n=1 Tax=Leucobacter sp. M11 TaxID=2993565 RepID=UPI002D7F7E1D|nr:mechanosensitive ion channel family protein [Leucobacter sp. M11]MEB4616616.1 mechanosensitive ion channel family protein [Leucobacter sp. M11]